MQGSLLVGKESYCDYPSIQAAVDELESRRSGEPETIYILPGMYEEAVRIYRSDLTLQGIGRVEIVMNRSARQRDDSGQELGTFGTPTLFLGGRRLVLSNLIVVNSAGPGERVGQALALYAHCDETLFLGCSFHGHQDTLFTGPLPPAPKDPKTSFGGVPLKEHHARYRQYYHCCRIEGTVDFIFGGATAFFDHCLIHSLKRVSGGPGYITAASTPEETEHGFIFDRCYLTADPGAGEVYLGRPWREFAKTDFIDCRMGPHIHSDGWHNWNDPANERTVRYREFGGAAAASAGRRVRWAACHAEPADGPKPEQVFSGTDFWKRA